MVNKKLLNSKLEDIFSNFNFTQQDLLPWITNNNFKTIAVQVPEGLIRQAIKLIWELESQLGITIMFFADPCFGACDLVGNKVQALNVDGIVHMGHSMIPNCPQGIIPIKYLELQFKLDPKKRNKHREMIKKIKSLFEPGSCIGLVCSVQYLDYMDIIKKILEENNFKIKIGKGNSRIKYPGQVLGCNFSAANAIMSQVTGFLYIGDGRFHPLGISLSTKKPVIALDPINNALENIENFKEQILRQRNGAIARVKNAKTIGILLSFKPGQLRLVTASKLKAKLNKYGKQALIICNENLTPDRIDFLPIDAFVNTSCPRLAIDDYLLYKKPLITPVELEIALGERKWENYQFDEIL